MSDRKVRLAINDQEGNNHEVDTGIPQGLTASPSFSPTIYLSRLLSYVEEKSDVKGLTFVDDVVWLAEGKTEEEILETAVLFA